MADRLTCTAAPILAQQAHAGRQRADEARAPIIPRFLSRNRSAPSEAREIGARARAIEARERAAEEGARRHAARREAPRGAVLEGRAKNESGAGWTARGSPTRPPRSS